MTTSNQNVRLAENDFSDGATITATSELAGFPATNAANARRSLVWRPAGNFTVTASNRTLYINDGGDKTVLLTVASYTYATLAAHVQTQLNASSSGWTCTYDFAGGTFRFTVTRSTSGTLRFTQTTAAGWDMLGFLQTADTAALSFVADEPRNHTQERYVWDFGIPMTPTAFFAIAAIDEAFTPSAAATLTLKFNNIPLWDAPDQTVTLTRNDAGIFEFLDDEETAYRYVCFEVIDRTNPVGPTGLKFGRLWIGDYVTMTTSNVAKGFEKGLNDPSTSAETEGGGFFFNQRPKFRDFGGLEVMNLSAAERRELETTIEAIGTDQPFFISIDPRLAVSTAVSELTFYCRFTDMPRLTHIITDVYSLAFGVKEAV